MTRTPVTTIDAKITLADVARHAGVSSMTVSRVVNGRSGVSEPLRQRVQRAIDTLGYRPNVVARGLKAARSHAVGLLVPDVTNPYFPDIVRGAEDVAFAAGYTILLHNVIEDQEREAAALEMFEDRRVDGVIVGSPRLPEQRLHTLLRRHAAAVVINRRAPADVAGTVRVEHEIGANLAVRHLVRGGRTKLAILAGPPLSRAGRERLRGYRETLAEYGIPLPDHRIQAGNPTVDGGILAAHALLDANPDVDGILCFNDLVAAGALAAAHERGLDVPNDLAVVGYDDISFARMFTPALTTLRVPTYELGAHAMRLLLNRMHGKERTAGIIVQPELIVRASTPPPSKEPA